MDSTSTNQAVVFTTQTRYPLPSQKYMIPTTWRRYHLSQLVNKALALSKPIPFDFLIKGEILRGSIGEWCTEKGYGEEETLEIEYIESVLPPQRLSEFPHESWVSAVSCRLPGHFFTTAYDGHLRAFDLSRELKLDAGLHTAPITSLAHISSQNDDDAHMIATSSHDLTAQISRISLGASTSSQALAKLHLHTGVVSSVAANTSGTHLLTSSWDGLVGFWDTTIPPKHEVPEPSPTSSSAEGRSKKRRKVETAESGAVRKAPVHTLRSHLGRVTRAAFLPASGGVSCGFDSTIRTWDLERGLCSRTISAGEKPFVDLASVSAETVLALSTDRSMTLYDLRTDALSAASATFMHPATPSCIAVAAESDGKQVVTGAYDGVVRVWDVRSAKAAISSFKPFAEDKRGGKVLAVDWVGGVVAIGGEGGMDVWKVGVDAEASRVSA